MPHYDQSPRTTTQPRRSPPPRHSQPPRPSQPFRLEPGFSVMLPPLSTCETLSDESGRVYIRPDDVAPTVFGHPALILEERGEDVKIVLLTSFSLKDMGFGHQLPHIQKQHIPISPSPRHPLLDEQLHLEVGRTRRDCYLKVHQNWWMPKFLFYVNTDTTTKEQLKMAPESFDYALKAVAEYEVFTKPRRNSELNRVWNEFETERPFPGFPGVVGRRRPSTFPSSSPWSKSSRGPAIYSTPPSRPRSYTISPGLAKAAADGLSERYARRMDGNWRVPPVIK